MTECYAMVGGRVVRATALTQRGSVETPVRAALSRSLARVQVDPEVEEKRPVLERNTMDSSPRLLIDEDSDTLGFVVNAEFVRTDPAMLTIMTGQPLTYDSVGNVVGFDTDTHLPMVSFGLEVWSSLAGTKTKWGYTVFPHLRGGILSGFAFDNALVTFRMRDATTVRSPRWSVGPYDLTGWHQRLTDPVSRNTSWRNQVIESAPPSAPDGPFTVADEVVNGSAANPNPVLAGSLVGGSASSAGPWTVNGGGA